jgi:hypothetical protein
MRSEVMTASELLLDGRRVWYLGGRVALPEDLAVATANLDGYAGLEPYLAQHSGLRLVLVRLTRGDALYLYALYWGPGAELDRLDARVAAGMATDEDFADPVPSEPRHVVCQACGSRHWVLAVDGSVAPFATDKRRRFARLAFVGACPTCGAPWRLGAVEVLPAREAPTA